jgi:hypothetical protein
LLSRETSFALFMFVLINGFALATETPGTESWWHLLIATIILFPVVRSLVWFGNACEKKDLSTARNSVLRSQYAQSLDVTRRWTLVAPVLDVSIPDVGVARVRFFADRRTAWLNANHKWRYWKLPRGDAYSTLENPDFRKALASTQKPLVFAARPGRLQIRGNCDTGGSMLLRDAVRLATAWVKAVQERPVRTPTPVSCIPGTTRPPTRDRLLPTAHGRAER